jgi:uncharacterized protein YccT (UPF0319 family)
MLYVKPITFAKTLTKYLTMAKIIEENIVIKVSKLVKTGSDESLVTNDTVSALEQVAQELLGDSVIVEVEKA